MPRSPILPGRLCKSNSRRREPLTNVHNIPATSTSPPPLSAWRNLDSSEKAPSSKASGDDDIFIFPAPPAVLPSARTSLSIEITSIPGVSAVSISSASSRGNDANLEGLPPSSAPLPLHATASVDMSAGLSAEVTAQSIQIPAPALMPLQPLYPPPERTPTPTGLPSYEASQRAAETRVARRLIERHLGMDTSSGLMGSRGRRRRGGEDTTGPRDAPVWRPPVSQHAFGNHPFMQDMRLQGDGGGGAFGAEIETAARGGRSARPVRLEDYYFLRTLESGGGAFRRDSHSGAACDWNVCWAWNCGCLPARRHPSDEVDLS